MKHSRPAPSRPRHAGVAMIETVLTLPFIFLLLALIMYCGVTMIRWHRVSTVDRYEAWRATAYAPGPQAPAGSTQGGTLDRYDATPLANFFFPADPRNNADPDDPPASRDRYGLTDLTIAVSAGLNTAGNQGPAITHLLNAVENTGDPFAVTVFETLFYSQVRPLPTTRVVRLSGDFASRFGLRFAPNADHAVSRLDGDWRYVNDAIDYPGQTFYDRRADQIDVPLYEDEPDLERPNRIVSPGGPLAQITQAVYQERLRALSAVNPLAQQLRDFTQRVPEYRGHRVPDFVARRGDGSLEYQWDDPNE